MVSPDVAAVFFSSYNEVRPGATLASDRAYAVCGSIQTFPLKLGLANIRLVMAFVDTVLWYTKVSSCYLPHLLVSSRKPRGGYLPWRFGLAYQVGNAGTSSISSSMPASASPSAVMQQRSNHPYRRLHPSSIQPRARTITSFYKGLPTPETCMCGCASRLSFSPTWTSEALTICPLIQLM